tara:strand:+ start:488 stop:1099 length:612 start_codon:yes stop_codon:yes gene_type:complete
VKKEPADSTLVRKIKASGCNESYKLLRLRHEKLFYKICQNYLPIARTKGIKPEDILDEKDFVIFKAIKSYKNNKKTKFSTWLGNCTKYFCLTMINSNNRLISSEDDFLKVALDLKIKEEYIAEDKLKYDKEYIFNILDNLKDKRISTVFKLRYFESFKENNKPTWSFIAKKIKTSTQTAINLHQRGKEILFKKLNSEQFQDMI